MHNEQTTRAEETMPMSKPVRTNVKRLFLTGMSGVGKSTLVRCLRSEDVACVDLDEAGWMTVRAEDGEPLIDLHRVREWLRQNAHRHAIVAGCAVNQGELRGEINAFVLLTAPDDVMRRRILARSDNPFGKDEETWQKILRDKEEIEPILRRKADFVIDTDRDLVRTVHRIRQLLM